MYVYLEALVLGFMYAPLLKYMYSVSIHDMLVEYGAHIGHGVVLVYDIPSLLIESLPLFLVKCNVNIIKGAQVIQPSGSSKRS